MESSMLVKGNIPHSEPTVSIGLVLPEDNQTELMISFSNLNAFKFILDGTPVEIAETDITIRVQNNELAVKEHQVKEMWCIPLSAEKDDYIQLNPIRAGRGFHWEKNIKIKGIFETTQAGSKYSQYKRLKDFGLDVIKDKNKANMHHKVFIIDNEIVITGSFNPSESGNKRNDENVY